MSALGVEHKVAAITPMWRDLIMPVRADLFGLRRHSRSSDLRPTADSVVPPDQSRAVAAAGPVEVAVVEGADHNDAVLFEGDQAMGAVARLADRITAGR